MTKGKPTPAANCANTAALNILIAYEDVGAAHRAMRLFARVGQHASEEFLCQSQPWRFDLLADPDWGKRAASDAMTADLIVVTTSSRSDLPAAVQHWVAECLARKQGAHGAVVALFGAEGQTHDPPPAGLQFLQSAARKAGLDFFAPLPSAPHLPLSVRPKPDLRAGRRPSETSKVSGATPPQASTRPNAYRAWGINE